MRYEVIAKDIELQDDLIQVYTEYMRTRWPGKEKQHADTGYAAEWAMRFKQGRAYAASDSEGRRLLKSIAPHLCD